MDAAFTSIAFAEPSTAATNLALLEHRLSAALWAALPTLLAQVPDPDGSLNYLERYLRDAPPRITSYLGKKPAALHYLLLIFSYSHFLSESLLQRPELILWLHRRPAGEGIDRLKSREDLHEEYARFAATSFDQPASVVLARFKRREYLRITLRDVLNLATLAETTLELSHLADVLLEQALRISEQKLENAYGIPQIVDSTGRMQTARVTILSLGKLGGQELNYSSDIDLMFLYGQDGETSGGSRGSIANVEFFVRLAQAVLRMITEATPEGAVFRVDLRLRPEGQQGDVAMSLAAALDYYRTRAREWELQMLIKVRPSAGDLETGRRFLRELQPLIYRPTFHLAAVEAVLNARQEMTKVLRGGPRAPREHDAAWNVKLTPGGIRDVEFLAQCLQRLHGGTDRWLAGRGAGSTLVALQRLHDKGYLTQRDFFRLGTAYQFLRKVEHRLQLRDGLQRHTLPESPRALDRLARRCGIEAAGGRTPAEQLQQRITQHFAEVREIYQRILLLKSRDSSPASSAGATSSAAAPGIGSLVRLQGEFPALAEALAERAAADDPHARRGLHQFLDSAMLDRPLMNELERHTEWIVRAASIFALSDLAAEMLARRPEGIRIVAETQGTAEPAEISPIEFCVAREVSFDAGMASLRDAYRVRVLRTILQALLAGTPPFETFAIFTGLADAAIRASLQLAFLESGIAVHPSAAPFAVIALGRLGTLEMDVGSDADLLFVVEEGISAEEKERWRRLGEKFVHVVSSHTREGLLFPVDTRLRPRGNEGEILQTLAYLREYFRDDAKGWEAATILKARAVAGNPALAASAIEQTDRILRERFQAAAGSRGGCEGTAELARQLAHTRKRLEREGGESESRGGIKRSKGGFFDIDYTLAFLKLTRGIEAGPQPLPGNTLRQIAALESSGSLASDAAQTLRAAALLYRALDHALRLVTGRPAAELPEPAQIPRVVRLLKRWGVPVGESLEAMLDDARSRVRALYDRILLAAVR